ncbi:MAG: hypothetical protein ACI9R3_002430 [Verrucomicrobiales bacterium]
MNERFPGASETFKDFMRSFLTFRCEYLDVSDAEPETVLQHVLVDFINYYKGEFLPAGFGAAPAMIFESRQRRLIKEFSNEFDIEDFFHANPLLA